MNRPGRSPRPPATRSGTETSAIPRPDARTLESRLQSALESADIRVAAGHRRSLVQYIVLLAQWNRVYNLTGVRDPFAMVDRHVVDSLTAREVLVGTRLLDVGTGAGLPGLVLAIVRPDVRCTLLDPVRKKTRFCAHAAMMLGLDNVEVVSERLATHRPQHPYSTVISRATLSVAELVAGAQPVLDSPGRIVAMKGPRPDAELDVLDCDGFEARVEPVGIRGQSLVTTLVLIDRTTPNDGVAVRGDVTIG